MALVKPTAAEASTAVRLAAAVAAGIALTAMASAFEVALTPRLSVTVRSAEYAPTAPYVWLGFCAVELCPSPNNQAKVYGPAPPAGLPVKAAVKEPSPAALSTDAETLSAGVTVMSIGVALPDA